MGDSRIVVVGSYNQDVGFAVARLPGPGETCLSLGQRWVSPGGKGSNQAIAAAKTLAGIETPYREIPWFWSNQYQVNLQFLGLPKPGHEVVVRGDPARDKFTLFFLDGSQIAAVVAANNMRELKIARKLMETATAVDASVLADEARQLQNLLPRPVAATQ